MQLHAGPARFPVRGALAIWFCAMLAVGAILLAKHLVALPAPFPDQKLANALIPLRGTSGSGKWLAVHVLYAECRCSQNIVKHLVESQRPAGWDEVVLWVGSAEPDPGLLQRFSVKRLSSSALAHMGIVAAPLLVVLGPTDRVRYVGGYTERKQGPVINDLNIFSAIQRESVPAPLPVFGCAMSERLQRQLSVIRGL